MIRSLFSSLFYSYECSYCSQTEVHPPVPPHAEQCGAIHGIGQTQRSVVSRSLCVVWSGRDVVLQDAGIRLVWSLSRRTTR